MFLETLPRLQVSLSSQRKTSLIWRNGPYHWIATCQHLQINVFKSETNCVLSFWMHFVFKREIDLNKFLIVSPTFYVWEPVSDIQENGTREKKFLVHFSSRCSFELKQIILDNRKNNFKKQKQKNFQAKIDRLQSTF